MDSSEDDGTADSCWVGSEVERGFGFDVENDCNPSPTAITVGMEFDSYEQLYSAITDYKYLNYVDLYKRSTRGLHGVCLEACYKAPLFRCFSFLRDRLCLQARWPRV